MAKKSKFIDNIVFINHKNYHNKKYISPYIFIMNMKKSDSGKTNMIIDGIDLYGNERQVIYSKSDMYKDFEILNLPHLRRDFIDNIFRKEFT